MGDGVAGGRPGRRCGDTLPVSAPCRPASRGPKVGQGAGRSHPPLTVPCPGGMELCRTGAVEFLLSVQQLLSREAGCPWCQGPWGQQLRPAWPSSPTKRTHSLQEETTCGDSVPHATLHVSPASPRGQVPPPQRRDWRSSQASQGVSVLMESRPRTPFPTAGRAHLASDSVSWTPPPLAVHMHGSLPAGTQNRG